MRSPPTLTVPKSRVSSFVWFVFVVPMFVPAYLAHLLVMAVRAAWWATQPETEEVE